MPKYTPSDDELTGYGSEAPPAPAGEEAPSEEQAPEDEAGESTAIISNKVLSPDGEPINEGDEIVLQVVKNYGDESEVKYAPKEEGGEETPSTQSSPAEELAALDQEGGGY